MTDKIDPAFQSVLDGLDDPLNEIAKLCLPISDAAQDVFDKLRDLHGEDGAKIMHGLCGVLFAVWLATAVERIAEEDHPAILLNVKARVDDAVSRLLLGESLRSQIESKEKD